MFTIKTSLRTFSVLMLLAFLYSCSSDKAVVSHSIQKRKYRPGFHVDWGSGRNGVKPTEAQESKCQNEPEEVARLEDVGEEEAVIADEPSAQKTTSNGLVERVFAKKRQASNAPPEAVQPSEKADDGETQQIAPVEPGAEIESSDFEDENEDGLHTMALFSIGIAAAVFFLLWLVPFLNVLANVVGLVLAIMALTRTNDKDTKTLAIAGVVVNSLLLLVSIGWTALIILIIVAA